MPSTIEKFPDPANPGYSSGIIEPERTAEAQAAYDEGVADAKTAAAEVIIPGPLLGQLHTAIDAACLPPAEEEIEVSEAMVSVGKSTLRDPNEIGRRYDDDLVKDVFREMERQRRKDET